VRRASGYGGDKAASPFWVGRPHVHILQFTGQRATAKVNEDQYGEEFGLVLAGVANAPSGFGRAQLPKNLRTLNDYAVYVNSAATLWVWARNGLNRVESSPAEGQRARLIDEHEVQGDLLNLGHIMHRRLYQESRWNKASTRSVLRAQADVLELEGAMRDAAHFGEIRDLLAEGWEQMGVPPLREGISRLLAIQHAGAQITEAESQAQWQTLIAVIFGLTAVPPLANEVLRPIWSIYCLARPQDDAEFQLLLVGVSLVVVLAVLATVMVVLRVRKR
jgi:hypothetical protein